MKKFTIPCDFRGVKAPVTMYIGNPERSHHPLQFQSEWLAKERGGVVPQDVMESLQKLKDLADRNGVSFEELCEYALSAALERPKAESMPKNEQVNVSSGPAGSV